MKAKLIDTNDWYARVYVSIPMLKEKEDAGFDINLGAVILNCEGRTFVLDSYETSFTDEVEEGENFELCSKLEIDLETFPVDKEYNYELTLKDLKSKKIKGTFFCAVEDGSEDEEVFDFDNADVTLVIFKDNKEIQIKLELE